MGSGEDLERRRLRRGRGRHAGKRKRRPGERREAVFEGVRKKVLILLSRNTTGGKLKRTDPVYVGKPGEISSSLIGSDAPFIITKADLDKSTRSAGNNKNYSSHNMDRRFIETLPARINDAKIAYTENRNGVNSFTYVVFNEYTNALTAIGGEKDAEYEGKKVNRIKSIYDIGTPEAFLQKEGKELRFADNEAAKDILERA